MNEKLFRVHDRLDKHCFVYKKRLPDLRGDDGQVFQAGLCSCGAGMWMAEKPQVMWGDNAFARTFLGFPHLAADIYKWLLFLRSAEAEGHWVNTYGEIAATNMEIIRALMHLGQDYPTEYMTRIIPGWRNQ
jgi:hypothetical protein